MNKKSIIYILFLILIQNVYSQTEYNLDLKIKDFCRDTLFLEACIVNNSNKTITLEHPELFMYSAYNISNKWKLSIKNKGVECVYKFTPIYGRRVFRNLKIRKQKKYCFTIPLNVKYINEKSQGKILINNLNIQLQVELEKPKGHTIKSDIIKNKQ